VHLFQGQSHMHNKFNAQLGVYSLVSFIITVLGALRWKTWQNCFKVFDRNCVTKLQVCRISGEILLFKRDFVVVSTVYYEIISKLYVRHNDLARNDMPMCFLLILSLLYIGVLPIFFSERGLGYDYD